MQYEVCGQSLSMFNGNPSVYAIGYPMYVFYGYRVNGIIQQGEDPGFMSSDGKDQPGELKYVDLNGDYAIDDRDRCIIGDPNPDFTASLNLSFRYKNLDVSVFLNGVFGNDVIYNGYTYDPRVKIKRWTPDNPTNEYPRRIRRAATCSRTTSSTTVRSSACKTSISAIRFPSARPLFAACACSPI